MFSFLKKTDSKDLAAIVPASDGLTIATLKQGGERPRLEACDFIPWGEEASREKLLAQKVKEYGLAKRPCTTLMELGDYSILSVEAPDVPPAELRAAIRWQVKDLIDFHIDDAIVDIFDAPPSGAHGHQNSLYVVVSKTSTVKEKVDALQGAEANLTTIDIPELVLRNITARLPEDEGGVAMIYLERERGVVVVTRQSTLYFARSLDMGYEQLRQGMDDGSGLSLESNALFDRVVLEVQRSLDYYDRYFVQPPVAGLVIAPTEQSIPGLDDYLNQALGLPVRILDLGEIMDCDSPMESHQQAHCLAAIGAALREETSTL
jgi:MSHA biogenesis protein MshI